MTGLRPPSPLRAAALGGGLLAVAFVPATGRAGILLLVLAFIPWMTAHEALLAGSGGPSGSLRASAGPGMDGRVVGLRQHGRVGAAFAGTFWALNLAWVVLVALRIQAAWPVAAWLAQVLLLGLLGAGAGVLYAVLRREGLPVWAAGPGAWMTTEWARGTLLGPLRFPWSPTALPLAAEPALLQPGAWVGGWGLGVGAVTVAGLLAAGRSRRRVGPLVAAALLLAAWYGQGRARAEGVESRAVAEAVVVQPALALALRRAGGPEARRAVERRTDSLLQTARARGLLAPGPGGPPVVILPETHLPRGVTVKEARSAAGLAGVEATVLLGVFRETGSGTANSLVQLEAGAAVPAAWYDKRALVPGVEWGGSGGLVAGASAAPLPAPGRPGVLICIESAWSALARTTVEAGAGWLVNVTNDAWLAEAPIRTRSPAFAQHPAHLQLRAVETGRGALRVGNNGWSGTVTPTGAWSPALPPHRPGVARVTVRSATGPGGRRATPWVARGHHLPGAASGGVLLLALVSLLREGRGFRRGSTPVDPP